MTQKLLKHASVAELKEQLAIAERKESLKTPDFKSPMNFDRLVNMASNYMEYIKSEEYHEDDDDSHYYFEEVMKAVYGNDVFEHIRAVHKSMGR